MNYITGFFSGIALALLLGCQSSSCPDPEKRYDLQVEKVATEALNTWFVDARPVFATAFPIATGPRPDGKGYRTVFLTAGHNTPPLKLVGRDGISHATVSVTPVPNRDVSVAVIYTDEPVVAMKPATRIPEFGDRLWLAGYFPEISPQGILAVLRLTTGYAADVGGRMAVSGAPGCSGGPVLNDDGEVVGVMVGGFFGPPTHVTVYEPLDDEIRARIR